MHPSMRSRLLPLLVLLALLAPACAKAPPNLTPPAVVAFHGLEVIHDLDRVRDAATAAHQTAPPLLSAEVTLQVVTWHDAAITVVHEAKNGWRADVLKSVDALRSALSPHSREVLGPYLSVLTIVLTEVPQ